MKRQWIFALVAVSAVAAEGANVKAFIPTLTPLKRVEAVYPEAARQENAYGMVHVLVTFDPAGRVTAIEALEGPAVLRQAAIDAVTQWTFRPVQREGHAVSAMTSVRMEVVPPRAPGARPLAPKMNFDPQETMAATQRLARLEEQFPRSPAQVLADFEQQSSGDEGVQRFYRLDNLAKAAARAGDWEKAQSYAAELLKLAPEYRDDWNYGNAIHDGNMVLGLVEFHRGKTGSAEQYLLEAGKTPGSPQLNSFGPNMALAKELIDAGEGAAVLPYFDLCRAFWKMGAQRLDDWSAMVRDGGKPYFGANLLY
jgi:TonB family protein